MPAPTPFPELPEDTFNFSKDWFEIAGETGASNSNFTLESQESTRVGYIEANKMRNAIKFFLGSSEATADYKLKRVQPHWDPEFPWLFAHSVSFTPFIPKANTANPQNQPWKSSQFSVDPKTNRYTKYHGAICTVKYRAFRCLFLPDSAIKTSAEEYKRNTVVTASPKMEVLSADGVSQLTFAETSVAGGGLLAGPYTPSSPNPLNNKGTPFPAPIGVLLPKATFVLEWMNVAREYLADPASPFIFYPRKILNCMGKVNNAIFLGFAAGTLLCQPPEFIESPSPFPSDTIANTQYDIMRNVTVRIAFDFFAPKHGAAAPITSGHNMMPWRANGRFYLATRDGTANLGTNAMLEPVDFTQMFTHVDAP